MTARKYVHEHEEREDPDGCPVCGNRECTLEDQAYEGDEYMAFYECDACGQEFTEVYTYRHTEYTKEITR